MAIDFNAIVGADLGRIISDVNHSITHDETSISCVVSALSESEITEFDGILEDTALSILAPIASFSTAPKINDRIIYDTVSYTIVTLNKDPNKVSITILCQEDEA